MTALLTECLGTWLRSDCMSVHTLTFPVHCSIYGGVYIYTGMDLILGQALFVCINKQTAIMVHLIPPVLGFL